MGPMDKPPARGNAWAKMMFGSADARSVVALKTADPEPRDLARSPVPLVEASTGRFTGAQLGGCIGAGGMSSVFLAQLDPASRSDDLSPLTPRRFAVKIMQLATHQQLVRINADPASVFLRE